MTTTNGASSQHQQRQPEGSFKDIEAWEGVMHFICSLLPGSLQGWGLEDRPTVQRDGPFEDSSRDEATKNINFQCRRAN